VLSRHVAAISFYLVYSRLGISLLLSLLLKQFQDMKRILSWGGRTSAKEGTRLEKPVPSAQEPADEPWVKVLPSFVLPHLLNHSQVPVSSTAQQSLRSSLESSINSGGEALGFKVLAHGHNASVE
jgi:hypothetical protein